MMPKKWTQPPLWHVLPGYYLDATELWVVVGDHRSAQKIKVSGPYKEMLADMVVQAMNTHKYTPGRE